MMPSRIDRLTHESSDERYIASGNSGSPTYMTPKNHLVLVAIVTGRNVVLPPVNECAGQIYTIRTITRTSTNTCTLSELGDSAVAFSPVTFSAVGKFVCVMSDGESWMTLASN